MKLLLLLLLVLLPPALLAQREAVSGGNDAAGVGGSISYSIGQVGYTTVSDQGGTSSAGVQQPLEYLVLAVDEEAASGAHLAPNPTSEGVQLTLSWEPGTTQFYVLMDAAGQVLRTAPITGPVMDIPLGELPSAIYLLRVEGGGGHTFQIIKQ